MFVSNFIFGFMKIIFEIINIDLKKNKIIKEYCKFGFLLK